MSPDCSVFVRQCLFFYKGTKGTFNMESIALKGKKNPRRKKIDKNSWPTLLILSSGLQSGCLDPTSEGWPWTSQYSDTAVPLSWFLRLCEPSPLSSWVTLTLTSPYIIMYVCFACLCICASQVCLALRETRRGCRNPWKYSSMVTRHLVVPGTKLMPLARASGALNRGATLPSPYAHVLS